jgi:hypothetical protein
MDDLRSLLTVGSRVLVVLDTYGTDHYMEMGTITAIDNSLAADTRWRVLFADGDYEYMYDDELELAPSNVDAQHTVRVSESVDATQRGSGADGG